MIIQIKRFFNIAKVTVQQYVHGNYSPIVKKDFDSLLLDEFGLEAVPQFNAYWYLSFPIGNKIVELCLHDDVGLFQSNEFMQSPLSYLAEKTKGLQWDLHFEQGCDVLLYDPLSSDMKVWESSDSYHDFWFDAKKKVTLSEFLSVWENLQTALYI